MTGEQSPGPPPPPPEIEQAVMLGHIDEAVNLYVTHTGIDEAAAREAVERLVAEHS